MTTVVSIFNHKGGVSKTTTTFNLGWMLARLGHRVLLVDADPQCNLTGVSLGLSNTWPLDDFAENSDAATARDEEFRATQLVTKEFYTANVERTLYGALKPAFESEPRMLDAVECAPIVGCDNLFLLPGHIQIGEYEVSLSVAQELSGTLLALRNIPGAINYLIRATAEAIGADFVLVDMSPSLGSLNQNIVATSDLVFVPTSPDFYTVMALRSLSKVLPRWYRWAKSASENETLQTATYPFPEPRMKFAGAVIQRYRLYRAPTEDNPYGDPTGPFKEWIDRVAESIRFDFAPPLKQAGLMLPTSTYQDAGIGEDYVLGRIQEFNSLLPKSQEHRLPVFELTSNELGQSGVVLDASMRQISSLNRIFKGIAEKVAALAVSQP
ncbi:AAA domain-containing protein [Micromonospora pisi]|uniref:AAA domain-containing protein n=1 Tax=Micromonospora pisi TaxID=589240 RepID=A0A495JEZ0_9ACTN|nr:AAA family ATPase [Micromonospora pisi]RKR87457.1 AAA domain-containing protein [Micromonospora pisi]